mgnify:CR=1 FL=1
MNADAQIAAEMALCYADPLRFVQVAYPWGVAGGPLADYAGPDVWQTQFLTKLGAAVRVRAFNGVTAVEPIRMAVSSGHGVGKSAMSAWLVNWLMSTRPQAIGTVSANSFPQLETKTWASIQKWTQWSITGHWFTSTGMRLYHPAHKASYFVAPQSCKEENSEAFAGQHNITSTSFYIFDESSSIPDAIFGVANGGLTDGEPMIFLFGNPTRSTGLFYRACFGSERNRWESVVVDSRESAFTNKDEFQKWIDDYGLDSDYVRVRVRGLPPRASDAQFIDADRIAGAQAREVVVPEDEPLVAGFDVARGGGDHCVLRYRRGLDAASIPPLRILGEHSRDTMRVVTILAEAMAQHRVQMLFVDGTGIGGPLVDRLQQLGLRNVVEVQFGGHSPDPKYANMRAFMWGRMKEWLARGRIDRDPRLEMDLGGPGYDHNKQDQIVLESKERMKARGVDSPDDGDALALTLAQPVTTRRRLAPIVLPSSWEAM